MRTHDRTRLRLVTTAVLGWLTVASVLAPAAGAAAAVTVPISDLTAPAVTVEAGAPVTFVNQLEGTRVQVGGGLLPTPVEVTAQTVVTLELPSGSVVLYPGDSATERFDSDCTTCTITYAHRLDGDAGALADVALPALPVRAPLLVQTLAPAPAAPPPAPAPPPVPAPAPTVVLPQPPAAADPAPAEAPVPRPADEVAPGPAAADPAVPSGTPAATDPVAVDQVVPTPGAPAAPPAALPSTDRPALPSAALDPASDALAGAPAPDDARRSGRPGEPPADGADALGGPGAAALPPPALSLPAVLALVALTTVAWALVRTLRARWAER